MANAKICDRCTSIWMDKEITLVEVGRNKLDGGRYFELCPECHKKVMAILENRIDIGVPVGEE